MGFKPALVEERLKDKFGFRNMRNRGKDHHYFAIQIDDSLPVIETHVSHNDKEIGPDLESVMAKQLHVNQKFFREMIGCTKDLDAYTHQVKTAPNPPFPEWMLKRMAEKDKGKDGKK